MNPGRPRCPHQVSQLQCELSNGHTSVHAVRDRDTGTVVHWRDAGMSDERDRRVSFDWAIDSPDAPSTRAAAPVTELRARGEQRSGSRSMPVGPRPNPSRRGRAFSSAVRRERAAVVTHELAATRHDQAAARHEQHALTNDDALAARMLAIAELARDRAERARARADSTRRRLIAEGIDPAL